jgi:nuclear RNA export factor
VLTISAAKNAMTRAQVQRIPLYLPQLRNLSLRDNSLNGMEDIRTFFTRQRSGGFRQLQEIWLVGNNLRKRSEDVNDLDQYF